MKRNIKIIYLVLAIMGLGMVFSFKINNFKNENLIGEGALHGTYVQENNSFVTLSFDETNTKYFYYGLNENYNGEFIYLGNRIYKITSGEFRNYFVKMINVKFIQMYNNNEKRVFERKAYVPTVIN